MLRFIGRRLIIGITTLLVIVTLTFLLVNMAPGDPVSAKIRQLPDSARETIERKYGLDKSMFERYFIYMKNLVQGDLGDSYIYVGRSVNEVIAKNAPVSGRIVSMAIVLQLIVGLSLGTMAGIFREKIADQIIRVVVVIAICIPSFVFAALLQYFVAFRWQLTPIFGWGEPIHYVMPVIAMTIGGLAGYTKYMRNSTIGVINEDYIVTAKAKGVSKLRLIRKHVLRNASIPIITMLGSSLAGLFGGSFILESFFGIPGLGSYYVKAIQDSDYSMIIGMTAFFAAFYIFILIIVDIMYGIADPRIRVAKSKL
jgi:oligopeptide transport system permease protein